MARAGVWFVTVPLSLLGVVCAHTSANRLFGSPQGAEELFASRRSGATMVPELLVLVIVLVLAGVHAHAFNGRRPSRGSRCAAVSFGLLPPAAFVMLEVAEGVLGNDMKAELLGSPTFIAGLLLQIPFAVAGYIAARVLFRAGDDLRLLLARRPPNLSAVAAPATASCRHDTPRSRPLVALHPSRAPPACVVHAG